MSTIVVKVCEECGRQSTSGDGWMVLAGIDIRSAGSAEVLVKESGADICSLGCLLRYVRRRLEEATNGQMHSRDRADVESKEEVESRPAAYV